MAFPLINRRPDLPRMERRMLKRWREHNVFARTMEHGASAPRFGFFEGPPTANGRPGLHHVEARVFKDVFPRYRTMLGEYVPRLAGWDCHGIPVELEVERQLGLSNKQEIEDHGVAAFNALCRESVIRYVGEFERLTERIGYWVDTDDAYWTMSRPYVQSVWWSLKELFDAGLIYEDDRVVPYCPRCGTGLSDHEVAQGYEETDDHSIFVRFPIEDGPLATEDADLLIWTTMPWTLIPATLAVISRDLDYVLAAGGRAGSRPVVLAASAMERALGVDAQVVRPVGVRELLGASYTPPFDFVGPGSPTDPDGDPTAWRFVVAGDFVRAEDGTGVVHTGAAYGEDDMRVARENGAPVVKPVGPDGRFDGRCGPYAGLYVRDADERIVAELRERHLLVHAGTHHHTFPFCWRCSTALLYYAKPSWYIATTRVRDAMLSENASIDWHPEHIRDGRFGDWLSNNVDWAISRERYWGTPLPFWRCDGCQHVEAIGSIAELADRAGCDLSDFDPHRPHVDEITLDCQRCGSTSRRVPEVIDAWYDSGAMPFAQFGFPHQPGSEDRFLASSSADLVCEAIDQTRGWFYSLLAISTMLFEESSYRRALCLGLIVDENGRKMSKSVGNVVDPWSLIDEYGADALRWSLLAEGTPWKPRRIGDQTVRDAVRRVLLTLWSTTHFFVTYANLDGWRPASGAQTPPTHPMDRWAMAELDAAVTDVRKHLDDFDATRASRRIGQFIEDLSNWYVRLNRQRFSLRHSSDPADRNDVFATLYECLRTLTHLIAPLIPFIADHLHGVLVRSQDAGAPDSVHLASYPRPDSTRSDESLRRTMSTARQLVTLGRNARSAAGIPSRQPLRRVVLTLPHREREAIGELLGIIASELNVKVADVDEGDADHMQLTVRPNFAALGPRFGRSVPDVARAIEEAHADQFAAKLEQRGFVTVDAGSSQVQLTPDDVEVVKEPGQGWVMSMDGEYAVALEVTLDRQLRVEGMARELSRLANELRREQDLDLDEVVDLRVAIIDDPRGNFAMMLDRHRDDIISDVNAGALHEVTRASLDGGDREPMGVGDALISLKIITTNEGRPDEHYY